MDIYIFSSGVLLSEIKVLVGLVSSVAFLLAHRWLASPCVFIHSPLLVSIVYSHPLIL